MDTWRKSSYSNSNGGSCIEVADTPAIGVRDTKQAHMGEARTVLTFRPGAWQGFVNAVRPGNAKR